MSFPNNDFTQSAIVDNSSPFNLGSTDNTRIVLVSNVFTRIGFSA